MPVKRKSRIRSSKKSLVKIVQAIKRMKYSRVKKRMSGNSFLSILRYQETMSAAMCSLWVNSEMKS